MSRQAITLYRHPISGHAHRVELFLSLLDLPFRMLDIDLMKREQKTPEFLAKNIFGQVPVIDDEGVIVSDSNAILVYLALRYDPDGKWLPRDPVGAAQVQRWLSVAAGQLTQGPAAARRIKLLNAPLDYEHALQVSSQLFQTMEQHLYNGSGTELAAEQNAASSAILADSDAQPPKLPHYRANTFFAGHTPTIADISLYTYTALSSDGGISLADYPNIRGWISRLESMPRFIPARRRQ
jgi:glutathione S-transferase